MAKKIVNGKIVEFEYTSEEIKAAQEAAAKAERMERSRPFAAEEVSRMVIANAINSLTVDDNTALRMVSFYPEWSAGNPYPAGHKAQRGGKLWRVLQAHTSQTGWEPENAPSLWEQINETHSGTAEDPIPYEGNMALEKGKYYMQDYEVYLCTRDTVNPVYNTLAELVGIYTEIVNVV